MAQGSGISVLDVVVLPLLLVCRPYTLAQNPSGCSLLPPNTLISGGPSGALKSNNVPNIETSVMPTLFWPAVVQTHGQYTVRLRSGSMDCGVKFNKQTQTIWQITTLGTGTTPHLVASLIALDNINNDSTPYQELKCKNQVGLVVDGEIVNNQGIVYHYYHWSDYYHWSEY